MNAQVHYLHVIKLKFLGYVLGNGTTVIDDGGYFDESCRAKNICGIISTSSFFHLSLK